MEADSTWVEIRDRSGKLLFKYNPVRNEVEIKKGGDIYMLIKLDEIREKHGVIPPHLESSEAVAGSPS